MQTQSRGSFDRLSILALCSSLGLGACDAHDEPEGELDELRIIDGSLTDQWPAVVGIASSVGLCTGTQISDRLILTAAHCLTEVDENGVITTAAPASVSVYWGADLLATLTGQPDPTRIGLRGATRIDIHPSWTFELAASTESRPHHPRRAGLRRAPADSHGRRRGAHGARRAARRVRHVRGARGRGGDRAAVRRSQARGGIRATLASFVDSQTCDSLTLYARVDVEQEFVDPFVGVSPVLECVDALPDGTYVAHFGYKDPARWTVERPVGPDNRFHPSAMDRGQPESFDPGRQVDVFTVPFTGTLVWKLGAKTSTASAGSKRC